MSITRAFKTKLKKSWHEETPRLLFNVLIAFLITFTVAHLYSLFVPFYIFIAGYHIHHFYHGMLLLSISSLSLMVTSQDNVRNFMSYVTGAGLGLIIDELGLLLNCTGERVDVTCQYAFPNNFDAVVIVSIILLIFIFFGDRPIRWFLPKSWRKHPALNKNIEQHVAEMKRKIQKQISSKK